MAAENELRAARAAGQRADELLKDPVLNAAFDGMQAEFFKSWRSTPLDRPDQRERLYMMFQCIDAVRAKLQERVQDAVMADRQLKDNGLS